MEAMHRKFQATCFKKKFHDMLEQANDHWM